jgi:class 3 adenylate cyclase
MDVGGWLRGLGLGQYEEKFRDNRIDSDLLPRLTVDDLKDIGGSVVGDRRRLLDAIAALADVKPPTDVCASPSKPSPAKGPDVSAERRPITVMFCDLVGSTSLAAKLDPEDWLNLVNAYLDEASNALAALGGYVLKSLATGSLPCSATPKHRRTTPRGQCAALAIQRALDEINAKNRGESAPELLARIGVESGPVVVEATGEVFCDAPNIAARVQAAAVIGRRFGADLLAAVRGANRDVETPLAAMQALDLVYRDKQVGALSVQTRACARCPVRPFVGRPSQGDAFEGCPGTSTRNHWSAKHGLRRF